MRLPLLAVLLCAALAGCGGDVDRRNAYVDAVNRARVAFDRDVERITGGLRETSTAARTRRVLEDLERAAGRFEDRLRVVRAPATVRREHAGLVAEARGYGEQFRRAQAAFRTDDPSAYLQARSDLQREVARAGVRLNAAIDVLNTRLRQ